MYFVICTQNCKYSYNNSQRVIQTLIATGWNLWEILIMSDQIVEKIYACVIFYCRCMYVVCYL